MRHIILDVQGGIIENFSDEQAHAMRLDKFECIGQKVTRKLKLGEKVGRYSSEQLALTDIYRDNVLYARIPDDKPCMILMDDPDRSFVGSMVTDITDNDKLDKAIDSIAGITDTQRKNIRAIAQNMFDLKLDSNIVIRTEMVNNGSMRDVVIVMISNSQW